MPEILNYQDQLNSLVLALAVEVGSAVVADISGNDISNSLNGQTVTRESLGILLANELTEELAKA